MSLLRSESEPARACCHAWGAWLEPDRSVNQSAKSISLSWSTEAWSGAVTSQVTLVAQQLLASSVDELAIRVFELSCRVALTLIRQVPTWTTLPCAYNCSSSHCRRMRSASATPSRLARAARRRAPFSPYRSIKKRALARLVIGVARGRSIPLVIRPSCRTTSRVTPTMPVKDGEEPLRRACDAGPNRRHASSRQAIPERRLSKGPSGPSVKKRHFLCGARCTSTRQSQPSNSTRSMYVNVTFGRSRARPVAAWRRV